VTFRADSLKQASAQDRFPYRERHVTFLRLSSDGYVTQGKGIAEKRAMLSQSASDDLLLAAWTGNYSTDIFVLDDLAAVRVALA
jgi:hypothetical protein